MSKQPMHDTTPTTQDGYRSLLTPCDYAASFRLLRKFVVDKKVLDIGCATGEYLREFGEGSIGADLSESALETCRRKGLQVTSADSDGEFEAVFCSHVLEHVDSPIALLREMNRVISPGCVAVIGLPVERCLKNLLFGGYYSHHPGHIYSFSLDCMKRLLDATGFEFRDFVVDLNLVKRLKLYPLLSIAKHMPPKLILPLSRAYWVVGEKRT